MAILQCLAKMWHKKAVQNEVVPVISAVAIYNLPLHGTDITALLAIRIIETCVLCETSLVVAAIAARKASHRTHPQSVVPAITVAALQQEGNGTTASNH